MAGRQSVFALCGLGLLLASGCSINSDPDPTATTVPQPIAPTATMTPSPTIPPAASATATASPTPVTPTATATPSPSPTVTRTPTNTPTPTPSPTPTIAKEMPFGNVLAVDPNTLTNFTLAITYSATGLPGNPNAAVELNVQQSSLDNYHVRVVTDGAPIESWAVNDAYYLLQEGGVVLLPAGIDGQLFAPAVFIHSTPLPSGSDTARRIGEETLNGRATTHYRMDPDDAARMAATDDAFVDGMRDATGALDIWLDNELGVVLKISGSTAWANADGSPGAIRYDYLLSDIGTTQLVAAPI